MESTACYKLIVSKILLNLGPNFFVRFWAVTVILNLSVYIEAATMVLLYNITHFHLFPFTVDSHRALTLSFPFNGQI
jgi:hypothetical protein